MGALIMMALFFLIISTLYLGYRVYFQRKYLSEAWLKEHGRKGTVEKEKPKGPGEKYMKESDGDGQISREIPKELNDSNIGGRGLPTDVYGANMSSKR